MSVRLCPADRRRKDAPGVRTFKSPTAALLVHRQDCLTQFSHGAFARTNDAVPLGCCPERRLAVTSRHDGTVPARANKSSVPRGGMTRRNTPERCLVRAAGRARTALPASWTNAAGRSMYQDRVNMDAVGERLGTKGQEGDGHQARDVLVGDRIVPSAPRSAAAVEARRAARTETVCGATYTPPAGPPCLPRSRSPRRTEPTPGTPVRRRGRAPHERRPRHPCRAASPRSQQAASLRAGGRGPPR
jgi:hypothetical protein